MQSSYDVPLRTRTAQGLERGRTQKKMQRDEKGASKRRPAYRMLGLDPIPPLQSRHPTVHFQLTSCVHKNGNPSMTATLLLTLTTISPLRFARVSRTAETVLRFPWLREKGGASCLWPKMIFQVFTLCSVYCGGKLTTHTHTRAHF